MRHEKLRILTKTSQAPVWIFLIRRRNVITNVMCFILTEFPNEALILK